MSASVPTLFSLIKNHRRMTGQREELTTNAGLEMVIQSGGDEMRPTSLNQFILLFFIYFT